MRASNIACSEAEKLFLENIMAQGRFERPTCCLGGSRSIHLSYWVGRQKRSRVTRENLSREYSKAQILSTRITGFCQGEALHEGQLPLLAGTRMLTLLACRYMLKQA